MLLWTARFFLRVVFGVLGGFSTHSGENLCLSSPNVWQNQSEEQFADALSILPVDFLSALLLELAAPFFFRQTLLVDGLGECGLAPDGGGCKGVTKQCCKALAGEFAVCCLAAMFLCHHMQDAVFADARSEACQNALFLCL